MHTSIDVAILTHKVVVGLGGGGARLQGEGQGLPVLIPFPVALAPSIPAVSLACCCCFCLWCLLIIPLLCGGLVKPKLGVAAERPVGKRNKGKPKKESHTWKKDPLHSKIVQMHTCNCTTTHFNKSAVGM